MRINKFLTEMGYCSRRAADRLIEAGRVEINGRKAVLGDQAESSDTIKVDGETLSTKKRRIYLMYNKPRGVVCTTDRREKDNIIDAVHYPERVFPIGRLDKDSNGLIFLTNDGDIVNRILRAQHGHEKEYWVNVDKPVDQEFYKKMCGGIDIGHHITLPCKLSPVNRSTFRIILTEGKNRQIRRMCKALGYKVRHLKRIRIMNVELGDLPEGQYKEIPPDKLEALKEMLDEKSPEEKINEALDIIEG